MVNVVGSSSAEAILQDAGLQAGEIEQALVVPELPVTAGAVSQAHLDQVEHALYRAGAGLVEVETRTSMDGDETVVTKQLAPDTAAARALLAAYRPGRYGDAPTVDARQYVIVAPPRARSTVEWLASVEADRRALPAPGAK